MDTVVDALSDFFLRHPTFSTITDYIAKGVDICLILLLFAGLLFLAFGKQSAFFYRPRSLEGICWKVGWVLMIGVLAYVTFNVSTRSAEPTFLQFVVCLSPFALLLFAQLYGNKYHRSVVEAIRSKARQEKSLSKEAIGKPPF